jgi:hypothetical protein
MNNLEELKDLSVGILRKKHLEACKNNDIETIKCLLLLIEEKHPNDLLSTLNGGLIGACIRDDLELVRYFLTTKDTKINANINVGFGIAAEPIRHACENGHLEIIKYLLTSQELKEHAHIDTKYSPFVAACRKNQLEVVEYFLNAPEIKDKISKKIIKDGVEIACRNGQVEPIKYLFEKTDLKNEENFHKFLIEIFELALEYKNLEVMRYFVFDLDMDKNNKINKSLKKHPNKEVENWFELKNMNTDLTNELVYSNDNNKKRLKL